MDPQLCELIEKRYDCRLNGSPQRLTGGYESAVWRWDSDRGDLVVRISPEWRTEAELSWVHRLVRHCATRIPEAVAPWPDRMGQTLFFYKKCPVSVFPYIAGTVLNPDNVDLCASAARLLGRIHAVAQTWTNLQMRPPSQASAPQSLSPSRYPPELVDPELDTWYRSLLQMTTITISPHHGDFYKANILCQADRIAGVIDWDESVVRPLVLETGWSAWEFSQTETHDNLDDDKARAFLAAYLQTSPMRKTELAHIVPAIRWRLRSEALLALAAAERGEDWDPEYTEREIIAFQRLKGRKLGD